MKDLLRFVNLQSLEMLNAAFFVFIDYRIIAFLWLAFKFKFAFAAFLQQVRYTQKDKLFSK